VQRFAVLHSKCSPAPPHFEAVPEAQNVLFYGLNPHQPLQTGFQVKRSAIVIILCANGSGIFAVDYAPTRHQIDVGLFVVLFLSERSRFTVEERKVSGLDCVERNEEMPQ
jgi:hypothetical protein